MRLNFPNLTRTKKAAKHLATQLSISLALAQRAIARACGYCDWHELQSLGYAGPHFPLDQALNSELFIDRQARLIIALAGDLSVADGDVQYALAEARLTGDRRPELQEQIAIRLACWRATILRVAGVRKPGAVGILKTPGRNGEAVILRQYGRPTEAISQGGLTTVADFEYVSPRVPRSLFLPMRLYLPYGYWTEPDGARVVFSRDYKPMWRLRSGRPIERLEPWLWIKFTEQSYLWTNGERPWESAKLRSALEDYLAKNGICTLPIFSDALPLLVHDQSKRSLVMADGAELLKMNRGKSEQAA